MKEKDDDTTDTIGSAAGACSEWVVQTWGQYKLGHSPFEHWADRDGKFNSEQEASDYAQAADSGFGGDTRYHYKIIPPNKEHSDR